VREVACKLQCAVVSNLINVLLLLHIVMYNMCLFELQLLLTNDLELTIFYDIHALLLY